MKSKIYSNFALLLSIFAFMSSVLGTKAEAMDLDPDDKISRQQLEAQITFFDDVLQEFSATNPGEAVRLWVKGDQSRNGVYKYAVACDKLKQQLIDKWGPAEKSFWIIGGSSPWLAAYRIISKTELSPTELQYEIEYQWASSAGQEAPSTEKLIVTKIDNKWCVSDFLRTEGYYSWR